MEVLIPLLVAVPLLTAAVLAAANRVISRRLTDVIAIIVSASVTVMAYLVFMESTTRSIVYWFGGWLPRNGAAIGISFVVDPFSGALAAFAGLLVTCALVVSWHYFEAVGTLFHVLMSVAAYALTGYKTEESSLEGALSPSMA
jgi:multicomponent Na+:H+ antiporter subunit D